MRGGGRIKNFLKYDSTQSLSKLTKIVTFLKSATHSQLFNNNNNVK